MPTINSASGTPANVNNEGKLSVVSVTRPSMLHVNKDHGECYSVLVDATSASTDDDFFYLKNKEDDDLHLYKIEGWCDDANQEIKILLGATDAGTDAGDALTPKPMNAGSGAVADVDCTQDETDLAITGGDVVALLKFPVTALELVTFEFHETLIIPKNQRLHMEAALAGLINLNIYFYVHGVAH